MKVRSFSLLAGAAMAAGTFLGLGTGSPAKAEVVDGPRLEWKMSAYGRSRPTSTVADKFVEYVSEATGGKFKIEIAYGEVLSPAREILDGMKIGAFEMGWPTSSYYPGKLPAHTVFDLPFLPFADMTVETKVMMSFYRLPEAEAEMGRWNARNITPLTLAPFQMVGKGTAPKSINDFRTKRIRAGGGMAEALRRTGVAVVQMPSPELYGALERGVVDGIVTSHDVTHAFKLYEVANWYATNLDMGVQQAAIAVTVEKWNALPPQYKKVFDEVAVKAAEAQVETLKKANLAAVDEFKKRGMTAVTFDPADREAFVKANAAPVWDAWVEEMDKKGIPGRKLLDFVLAEISRASM